MRGIEKYAYVWCLELDVTYKGDLTQWFRDVHAANPRADFITWKAHAPTLPTWPWVKEPNVYNATPTRTPRALFEDAVARPFKWWVTGDEHLRLWCAGYMTVT